MLCVGAPVSTLRVFLWSRVTSGAQKTQSGRDGIPTRSIGNEWSPKEFACPRRRGRSRVERVEHVALSREDFPMASRRRGFTLIELLVVILIIGVLIALCMPAVQTGGGISRRMQCSRNLWCVGLGLSGYLNTKGCFPNAGTFREPTFAPPANWAQPSVIGGCFTDVTGVPFWQSNFAGGAGEGRDAGPMRSWVVDVLPYLDAQDLYNAWNDKRHYRSLQVDPNTDIASNSTISSNWIGVLTCPHDTSIEPGKGNLSYVVNGGFSRWRYVPSIGWNGRPDGGTDTTTGPDWGPSIAGQTGVMFLGSDTGTMPWDRRTRTADITDGTGQTILATENLHAGYSPGSPRTGGLETNWACPHPNYVMFIASDKICPGGHCPVGGVNPTLSQSASSDRDGNAWQKANSSGLVAFEAINYGQNIKSEGMFPFPSSNHTFASSNHKGGINVLFCDGSVRFVSDTIDGTVYAKLITPAGSKLPQQYQQLPLTSDAY
jgi:prepilin-type N-terminal cleavage/methylation domain-containing protein/prepilin-type processing-associated H-X9-DG protein